MLQRKRVLQVIGLKDVEVSAEDDLVAGVGFDVAVVLGAVGFDVEGEIDAGTVKAGFEPAEWFFDLGVVFRFALARVRTQTKLSLSSPLTSPKGRTESDNLICAHGAIVKMPVFLNRSRKLLLPNY